MNVTTECYLLTKSDRINRTLDKLVECCKNENEVITTKELATILENVQKFIARELTTNN